MKGAVWIATAFALAVGTPALADPICVSSAAQQWDADDVGPMMGSFASGGWGLGGGGAVLAGAPASTSNMSVVTPAMVTTSSGGSGGAAMPPLTMAPPATSSQVTPPPQTWGFVFTGVPTTPTGPQTPITFLGFFLPGATSLNPAILSQTFTGTLAFSQSLGSPGSGGTSPTPEPASLVLLGMGLAGSLVRRRWFA